MKEKDIPTWNPSLNYYEQDLSTLQFFEEEYRKIIEGVTIGGWKMHPWLYFHINHFMAKITMPDKKQIIIKPPLDDHALYFTENYERAEIEGKGVFMFGTRGFSKTVIESSVTHWNLLTKFNGRMEIYGGDKGDLKDVTDAIKLSNENIHPAFYLNKLNGDWGTEVNFGLRERNSTLISGPTLKITSVDAGSASRSQKGAGGTPAGIVIDEGGKFDLIPLLLALNPKIFSQYGAILVPLVAGTGGDKDLSISAKKVLENPNEYDMLPMDYSLLDKHVPSEYRTWRKTYKKPFCTFVPGNMSYRIPVEKLESNMSEYLSIEDEDLESVKIKVTDWKATHEYLNGIEESLNSIEAISKQRMYHPRDTDDCFLSDSYNPFDSDKLIKIKSKLMLNNDYRKIELSQDMLGNVIINMSDKDIAGRMYENKDIDAPVVMYSSIEDTPPEYRYCSGLDDYKLTSSRDTESLGSFYTVLRRNMDIGVPIEKIVLSYAARPHKSHGTLHENIRLCLKMTNSLLSMEAIDVGFAEFLENKGFDVFDYVIPNINPSADLTSTRKDKKNSKYGIYPTPGNKALLLSTVVRYTKEEVVVSFNEEGEPITLVGADFIPDPYLLQEMIDYYNGGNFDRIDAFGWTLLYAQYLDKKGVIPKDNNLNRVNSKRRNRNKTVNISNFDRVGLVNF